MDWLDILVATGIPTALVGILGWWFKKRIDKRDAKIQEQQKNTEELILLIIQSSRANTILCEAIAKAVQRIPDAHCNGDMTSALEAASKITKNEKEFLFELGVKHIFED